MPMARRAMSRYSPSTSTRRARSPNSRMRRPSSGMTNSSTPDTNSMATPMAMAGYGPRRWTRRTARMSPAPTIWAISATPPPPLLPPAKDGLHVPKQPGDELDEPQQHDDDPRQAEHLGLFLATRLREEDVEDGDDDADARDLVNHGRVQLHGLCPPPASRRTAAASAPCRPPAAARLSAAPPRPGLSAPAVSTI